MLQTLKFRLVFGLALLIYLFVTITVLLETPVTYSNVNILNLHFKEISRNLPSRGSLNYDLYVLENSKHYKIGANWADCFYYSDFTSQVKSGDEIQLGIKKRNGFLSDDFYSVVALRAKKEDFLNVACINEEIANNKITLPSFGLAFLIIIYIFIYYQDLKDIKKKKGRLNKVN